MFVLFGPIRKTKGVLNRVLVGRNWLTKFKQLKQNPTKSREESLSAYLRKLSNEKIIDDATFHKILPSGSSPGVLYGLPKVHKASCPFRPIVSSVNAPINSKLQHPPRAYPGHLTVHRVRGGGNLNVALEGWGI